MVMVTKPRQIGAFDVAALEADHVAVVVVRCIFRTPLAIIPLANKAAPVLDFQLCLVGADLERGLLIAVRRGGEKVEAIVVALRQRDYLSFGGDGVRRSE